MRIPLSRIIKKAESRPDGYLAAVMAVSTIVGNSIEISQENLDALKLVYRTAEAPPYIDPDHPCPCCKNIMT